MTESFAHEQHREPQEARAKTPAIWTIHPLLCPDDARIRVGRMV